MTLCPHCGFNLTHDEIVECDGWRLDPRGTVSHGGTAVRLTPQGKDILHTLATAAGRVVQISTIAERLDSNADDPRNLVRAQICKINRVLRDAGLPNPIECIWGRGYRWATAA